jgi:hypothetical protein
MLWVQRNAKDILHAPEALGQYPEMFPAGVLSVRDEAGWRRRNVRHG